MHMQPYVRIHKQNNIHYGLLPELFSLILCLC